MTPIQWGLDHLHWPFIVAAAWYIRGWALKQEARAEVFERQLTNHIPTELLTQTALLTSMDKNIGILVDRGSR